MQTRRDRFLIILLCVQAAISAANVSSYMIELFPRPVIATVGLISTMLSSVTAAYVGLTKETEHSPERTTPTS